MTARGEHGVSRLAAGSALVCGLLGTVAAALASARGLEAVATWLYPFAWYPLLLAMEGAVALRHGRFLLLGRPRTLLSVMAWSVPLWMLWEILNFRLDNWHYVFVPDRRPALWTGILVSFATVIPACFLPAALFHPRTDDPPPASTRGTRGTGPSLSPFALLAVRLSGVLMLVLPLLWPRIFFPLVWGAFVLLVEPDLVRRAPSVSLLADLLHRRRERIAALLAGGAVAGVAWEALNAVARAGWIYTVPGLEEIRIFEMPPLGFLGFPPLALSCFALYQWLVVRGWAAPLRLSMPREAGVPPAGRPSRSRREADGTGEKGAGARAVPIGALVLVAVTLLGMEAWTIASRTPRLRDLPGLMPSRIEEMRPWGVTDPFELAAASPDALAGALPGVDPEETAGWVDIARLATTRGIGTRNTRLLDRWGIQSLEDLARADPGAVAACFRAAGEPIPEARVRVWHRAARAEANASGGPDRAPFCPGP